MGQRGDHEADGGDGQDYTADADEEGEEEERDEEKGEKQEGGKTDDEGYGLGAYLYDDSGADAKEDTATAQSPVNSDNDNVDEKGGGGGGGGGSDGGRLAPSYHVGAVAAPLGQCTERTDLRQAPEHWGCQDSRRRAGCCRRDFAARVSAGSGGRCRCKQRLLRPAAAAAADPSLAGDLECLACVRPCLPCCV